MTASEAASDGVAHEEGASPGGAGKRPHGRDIVIRTIYVDPPEPPEVLLERAFEAYCRILLHAAIVIGDQERREAQGKRSDHAQAA